MKYNFKLTKILLIGVVVGLMSSTVFTGCGKRIPIQKKPVITKFGNNNFSKNLKKEAQTNLVIGIVDPETSVAGSQELASALSTSISEIVSAKGFKLKGPFESFDDITYRDKKMIYLVFKPKLTLNIKDTQTKYERHSKYTHQEGHITVTGNLVISVDEPMTGQTFIKKRINLSDLGISVAYIKEWNSRSTNSGITGMLLDSVDTTPDTLIDNKDYALAQANSEVYKKVMAKIEQFIDREEIISFKPDILKLKGLKRF